MNYVAVITQNPKITLSGLAEKTVTPKSAEASQQEQTYVARVVTRIAFGINCTPAEYYPNNLLFCDTSHLKWQ